MVSRSHGIRGLIAAWVLLTASALPAQQTDEGPAAVKNSAAATNPATGAEQSKEDGAELARLIRQLDSDRFADRQRASDELARRGARAIPALEKAALGESREATTRSIDLLKRHFREGSPDAKAAAKAALEKIQAGDNNVASRAAKEALEPEPAKRPPGAPLVRGFAPAQIQIRMRAAPGNGQRIQVRIANGVKTTEVQEQGKKITIQDDPNNGIKVEITEKKNGKDVTKKYSAKNKDELKKKHPEAYKVYQKYNQGRGGIRVRAVQIGGLPLRIPAARLVPARRLEPRNQIADRLDKVGKQLEEARQSIKKIADKSDSADGEALRKSLKQIEDAAKELKEARAKLVP